MPGTDNGPGGPTGLQRLDSWKEIGAFFGRDERTVKRWERERGLPVHRVPGSGRGRVYAYPAELTEWLQSAGQDAVIAESAPDAPDAPDAPEGADNSPSKPVGVVYPPMEFGHSGDSAARVPELSPRLSLVHSSARQSAATAPATQPAQQITPPQAPQSVPQPQESPAASYTASHAAYTSPQAAPASAATTLTERPGSDSRKWIAVACVAAVLVAAGVAWRHHVLVRRAQAAAAQAQVSSAANAEAENLYLQGKFFWQQRTPESLTKAVDLFTQAIVHDPQYAPAYAGLAECYELLREFSNMPEEEAFPRALSAAQQAVKLNPNLAQGHAALAFAQFWWTWETPQALDEFATALRLDPNSVQAHHWYATALTTLGRYDEAHRQIDEAQRLDPGSRAVLADKGFILWQCGQGEDARNILHQVEQSDPQFPSPHGYLAGIALTEGNGPEFVQETRAIANLLHDPIRAHQADLAEVAFQQGGMPALQAALNQNTRTLYKEGKADEAAMARVLLLEGDINGAFHMLEEGYARKDRGMRGVRNDPVWKPYFSDPRFVEIQKKLGAE